MPKSSNRAAANRQITPVTSGDVHVIRKNGGATCRISGKTQERIEELCRIAGVTVESACIEAIQNYLAILKDDARGAAKRILGEIR